MDSVVNIDHLCGNNHNFNIDRPHPKSMAILYYSVLTSALLYYRELIHSTLQLFISQLPAVKDHVLYSLLGITKEYEMEILALQEIHWTGKGCLLYTSRCV